jgi:hypothetical protein
VFVTPCLADRCVSVAGQVDRYNVESSTEKYTFERKSLYLLLHSSLVCVVGRYEV